MRFYILFLLAACEPGIIIIGKGDTDTASDTDPGGDSDSDTDSASDTSDSDTGTTPNPGPCADGGWGYGSETSIIVVAGSDDSIADGSMTLPFGTIMAAVAYSATMGNLNVLIGEGTYFENLYMPLLEYDGLLIAGCGIDETTIVGDPSTEAVYWEGIAGAMAGFTIQVGENGIALDGASVTVTDVNITSSLEHGITVFNGGALTAEGVSVASPGYYGLDVQSGSSAEVVDGLIDGASVAAVRIEGGSVVFQQVTILNTLGNPGFGVYVGESSVFAAEDLTISGGMTAGIMGYDATLIGLSNATISGIVAPDITLEPRDQHADGVIMMLGGAYDPAGYMLAIDGLTVSDIGRAAVIAQGVTVSTLQGVTATTGYAEEDVSVFLQADAVMGDAAPNAYIQVAEGSELAVNWTW